MPAQRAKRNVAEEIAELERVFESDPRTERFWELADAYTRAGRYQEATAICKRGLTLHSTSARGFLALGRAFFGIGRLNAAGGALRRAIDIDPDLPEGYRLLGELLLRRGIYSEAVSLLERALEAGLEDRRLQKLHLRAVDALESQATMVSEPPDASRGMGNVAVAGTISRVGAAPEDEDEEDDDDLLFRRHDEAEAEKRGLALRAFRSATPGENATSPSPGGESAWQSLEAAWEARLDAQSSSRMLTDPDLPVSENKGVDIDLAPLSDPLAEGMPPIPETSEIELPEGAPASLPLGGRVSTSDPVSSAEVATADALRLARARAEMEANRIDDEDLEEDAVDTAVLELSTGKRPQGGRAAAVAAVAAETMADIVESAPAAQPDSPPALPDATDERRALREDAAEVFVAAEVFAAATPPGRSGHDGLLRELASQEPTEPIIPGSTSDYPGTAFVEPLERKGGGAGRWVLIVLLLGALGAGAYLGWRYFEARRRVSQSLDFARKARRVGTAVVLKDAQQRLERALRDQGVRLLRVKLGELRAEHQLLRALAWLWHRAGRAPKAPVSTSSALWPARAAAAAQALARGEAGIVERLLRAPPLAADDRALHHALIGDAHWMLGDVTSAEKAVSAALAQQAKLSAAWLTRAQLSHALGRWGAAQRAYRAILEAHPEHRQAAVGLAAVLQRRDPHHKEIARLLEPRKGAPLAALWRRLLVTRRSLIDGVSKRVALTEASTTVPRQRDLLIFTARQLSESCAFEAADKVLGRLRELGGAKDDPALALLSAELALARGLPKRALELLPKPQTPHARRLRAWALLLSGRRGEATSLLAKDRAAEAETLRVFASGLALLKRLRKTKRKKGATGDGALSAQVFEPLKLLARRTPRAAFALTWLQATRGAPVAELQARVATIPASSSARARGDLLLAQRLARRAPALAITALARAARRCPRFVPADLLRGEILLALERRAEARRFFSRVKAAGDESPRSLLLFARSHLGAVAHPRARVERVEVEKATRLLEQARRGLSQRDQTPSSSGPSLAMLLGLAQAELALARGEVSKAVTTSRRLHPRRLPRSLSAMQQVVALTLARAHRRGGETAAAKKVLEELARRAPDNAWAQLLLGELGLEGGRRERAATREKLLAARDLAEKQKALLPTVLARAHLGLARLALGQKKRAQALAAARVAIRVDPELAAAHKLIGGVLLTLRRRKKAAAALAHATKLAPRDATAMLLLAQAHRRGAAAKRAYAAFLKLEPKGKRARRARRALRRLR